MLPQGYDALPGVGVVIHLVIEDGHAEAHGSRCEHEGGEEFRHPTYHVAGNALRTVSSRSTFRGDFKARERVRQFREVESRNVPSAACKR